MEYSWEIGDLGTIDEVNSEGVTHTAAVAKITWIKRGKDAHGNVGTYVGVTQHSAFEVSASDFVSFGDLSEEEVVAWIVAEIGEDRMAAIDQSINNKIGRVATTTRSVPW